MHLQEECGEQHTQTHNSFTLHRSIPAVIPEPMGSKRTPGNKRKFCLVKTVADILANTTQVFRGLEITVTFV